MDSSPSQNSKRRHTGSESSIRVNYRPLQGSETICCIFTRSDHAKESFDPIAARCRPLKSCDRSKNTETSKRVSINQKFISFSGPAAQVKQNPPWCPCYRRGQISSSQGDFDTAGKANTAERTQLLTSAITISFPRRESLSSSIVGTSINSHNGIIQTSRLR